MNDWRTPQPWSNHAQEPLKAKPHCCEEASHLSYNYYIPCNKPAANVVGWKERSDAPIRMCEMCTDHNVRNRNGYIIERYSCLVPDVNPWNNGKGNTLDPWAADPMKPVNPWDNMNEDALLLLWADKKAAIEKAKAEEMDLRKYIVKREFPKAQEGTNNKELGEGYKLKAVVKYNYKLADNDTVEKCLDHISALGNEGPFIADRLVSWTPNFKLVEYRELCERKDKGDAAATKMLDIINDMLTITEAAPTLEIQAPKSKK